MRLLQVLVETEHLDDVLDTLREEDIDPVVFSVDDGGDFVRGAGSNSDSDADADAPESGPGRKMVQFPVPTEAVDRVRDAMTDIGIKEEYLVIVNAETAATPHYSALVDRYMEGTEEEERISNEEIRTKVRNLNPRPTTYYSMTVLSAFVATAGLLLDSPALVVGSMVIAPQIGAALTASVGTALDERSLFVEGIKSTLAGLVVAIVAAAVLGWGLKTAQFVAPSLSVTTVQQISSRTSPGLLTLLVALCAGSAGGFGLATELPVSIVGVAVAAAILPAAAAVGIGMAWVIPTVALGAFVLLAVNVTGIVLAGAATLWYLGYRPQHWSEAASATAKVRTLLGRPTTYVVLGLFVTTAIGPGVLLAQQIAFENQATTAVQDVIEGPGYEDLELSAVEIEFSDLGVSEDRREVTVTVRRPVDRSYPSLAGVLRRAITAETDERVTVTVEFVEQQKDSP
ncbi:TIGR00341 family protein [Halopelagius fulvigenes]|uniref:TIGR00341 family protein n=1 Tax=Halopelagius fulvigenes TaxID=1198324 RepID=A0ABD5U3X7_9EURY